MRRRPVLWILCLGLVAAAGPVWAQQSATLLLRSGERVTGDLVDMGGSDFTIRVSGQDRRIANGDVVVIDFSGSGARNLAATEAAKAGNGLLVLKSGELVEGRLDDVGGTRPLRLTFIVDGAPRDYHSDSVNRIYLGAPPASAVASSGGQDRGGTGQGSAGAGRGATTDSRPGAITVSATEPWSRTGLTVRRGQVVTFEATGRVRLGPDPGDVATVTGRGGSYPGPGGTMRDILRGALIGRIAGGQPFGIGDQKSIPMPGDGLLFLGVNDDDFSDNSGQFEVVVTVPDAERRRRR